MSHTPSAGVDRLLIKPPWWVPRAGTGTPSINPQIASKTPRRGQSVDEKDPSTRNQYQPCQPVTRTNYPHTYSRLSRAPCGPESKPVSCPGG